MADNAPNSFHSILDLAEKLQELPLEILETNIDEDSIEDLPEEEPQKKHAVHRLYSEEKFKKKKPKKPSQKTQFNFPKSRIIILIKDLLSPYEKLSQKGKRTQLPYKLKNGLAEVQNAVNELFRVRYTSKGSTEIELEINKKKTRQDIGVIQKLIFYSKPKNLQFKTADYQNEILIQYENGKATKEVSDSLTNNDLLMNLMNKEANESLDWQTSTNSDGIEKIIGLKQE